MNEKNRLTVCPNCGSSNFEEVGSDIYTTDNGDVISELQYVCHSCRTISSAYNSARSGEFTLNWDALL
jgi:RNA polymerase subunit RPABC4/transcription elongation factor Spt4